MTTTIDVATEAQLNQAIATVDGATSGNYVIQFTTNITEGTDSGASITFKGSTLSAPPDLYAFNLNSNVQVTIDGSNGSGGNFTLDGNNTYRGLLVYSGAVTIDNLTVHDAKATGGKGGDGLDGGGGGAGLGGGLFVASAGNVTLGNVAFTNDQAVGGHGGNYSPNYAMGGGGGLGGNAGVSGTFHQPVPNSGGGYFILTVYSGGGGIGAGATGGGANGTNVVGPGNGILLGGSRGAAGGHLRSSQFYLYGGSTRGGLYGGGGGSGEQAFEAGGGGNGASNSSYQSVPVGGFGGGGGGSNWYKGNGGFGGGGGGGAGGNGGFGGGGGADSGTASQGGFGAGGGGGGVRNNQGLNGGGGGGLGAGGAVFVQQGGQLTFASGYVAGGSATLGLGGAGGSSNNHVGGATQSQWATGGANGGAYGSGLFIQGNNTIAFAPAAGQTLTISNVIADQSGSGGTGANAGTGSLLMEGGGRLTLSADNTPGSSGDTSHGGFTGGITIEAGTVELASVGAAGSGAITFSGPGTLLVDHGDVPTNTIHGLGGGDFIDLAGIGTATTAGPPNAGNQVTFSGGGAQSVTLQFDAAETAKPLLLTGDGNGGTLVYQTQFSVGSAADLNNAIKGIDLVGSVLPNTAFTITLTSGFTLSGDLDAINLTNGDTLTINGANKVIDGAHIYRGLFAYSGAVTVDNLTIQNTTAKGGAGGDGNVGGGGGAGLGGGLFIGTGADVMLSGVSFLGDGAVGGKGGGRSGSGFGGGGGLGGAGGTTGIYGAGGGGGGVGSGASAGQPGIIAGGLAGGNGIVSAGGKYGGGGGNSGSQAGGSGGGGGGVGGGSAYGSQGGSGGFGGGSGGNAGGNSYGGFGGGGGGGLAGGNGGWGGGGGASIYGIAGAGGFGGGYRGTYGGGGGLGAGGGVFVQAGGGLIIQAGTESGGYVQGGGGQYGGGVGGYLGAGIFAQGNTTLTFDPTGTQTVQVSDAIADQSGSGGDATDGVTGVLVEGSGVVTLSGVNTYTGGTSVTGGSLSISADDNLGTGGTLALGAGTTVDLTSSFTLAHDITIAGDPTFDVAAGQTVTISATIADGAQAGEVEKTDSGALVLSGDNTYSGGTDVIGGSLSISADDNLGTGGTLALGAGTTLDLTAGFTLAHKVTIAGSATFDVTAGQTVTDSGGISGSTAALTKTDTGTLKLSASTNNFAALNVNGGTLLLGSALALQTKTAVTVAAGATLDLGGFQANIGTLAGAGTVTDSGNAATLTINTTSPTTFSGVIEDGAHAVTLGIKNGNLTLSGANTYSGATIISQGSLIGGVANAFSANSSVTVSSHTTLDLGGFNQTIALLISSGSSATVTNSGAAAATLMTGGSGNSTFAGAIQDGAHATGLAKIGTGALTLSGKTNTYTGGTDVIGGSLSISADANLGTGGTLALGNGTTLDLTSSFTLAHTITIAGDPTFDVATGQSVAISAAIADGAQAGEVEKTDGGTLRLTADNTYSGGTTIEGGTLELANASAAGSGPITFDSDVTLAIDGTTMPSNTLDGFTSGDTIDLTSIGNVPGSHVDMDYQSKVLTITEGSSLYQLNFNPNESFAGDFFHLTTDGNGTQITEDQIACYCRGTLLTAECGDVPVERLAIGDKVITASGALRPIKWIGTRSYGGRFIMGRKDILPICFKAGSLGDNAPKRDLWISPHHAMFLEGMLIEAKDLVNGVSILQAEQVEEVEYFHIELETHDVIIAEGALSESFVDDDSRAMFHNAHEYGALYADEDMTPARYCAPRLDQGYEFEAIRQRLARRAGLLPAADRPGAGALRGYVDLAAAGCIAGWAQNIDHTEAPVCLDIVASGRLIGQVLANRYRGDLQRAGLGSGRHSFEFTPPAGLAFTSGAIEVRRSLDGAALTFSTHALRQRPLSPRHISMA
ncbi:MAG: Hint domain-containing protein [Bradyrhizobium sp.]